MSKFPKLESKINYVTNNLILKLMEAFKDKFSLLCHTAELLYVSTDGFRATKRIAKVMMIFSQMYNSLHSYQDLLEKEREGPLPHFMKKHDKNKFL